MAEFRVATAYADFDIRGIPEAVDAAMADLRAKSAGWDLKAQVKVSADTALAKASLRDLTLKKNAITVRVDADTAMARTQIKAMEVTSAGTIHVKAEVDQPTLRKVEQDVSSSMSKVASRANTQFSALAFTGLSVGLPAAAAVGAAATLAVLGGVTLGFAGIGVAAAAQDDAVKRAFDTMTTNAGDFVTQTAAQFTGPLASALEVGNAAFGRLEPQIATAMGNSTGAVSELTKGVVGFAENAMPGMVVATENAEAPMRGLTSLLEQTGAGFTDMATNMATGSVAAGAELSTLGGIVRDALGFVGQLSANLANNGGPALQSFQGALRQAEGALEALTSSGGGAVGFLGGFTNAASGALTIVNVLSHGLALLPPPIAQFGGALSASTLILSKFGVDAGAAFDGVGGKMKTAITTGKGFGTAIGALAKGAMDPATLAVGAFALGLDLLGQHERDAAAAAQAQASRVQTLAQALRESNGAINDNVKATAAQALQQFTVADGTRNLLSDSRDLGLDMQTLSSAYLGSGSALGQLNSQIDAAIKQHTTLTASGKSVVPVVDAEGQKYQQFRDIINSGDFGKAVQDNKDLATATGAGTPAVTLLGSAMQTLSDNAATSADRVTALKSALDLLAGRTPVFEDAIKSGNDALRGMADGLKTGADKTQGFGAALLNVDGTVNTVTANGSKLQGLAEGLQGSFVNAASGIDQMVRSGVPLSVATDKVNSSLTTQRDAFVKIATQLGLTSAQAQALADKYGLIPNTVSTDITANIKQAQAAIDALPAYAAGTKGAVIISANADPATGKINETVQYADGSIGVVTVDGNKDPATGKVMAAVQYADGSLGMITIDALNQRAKDGATSAVRFANGSTGTIVVGANTSPATSAITAWMSDYIHSVTIPVHVSLPPGGVLPLGGAVGGLVGGGRIERFAAGGVAGAVDVSRGGRMNGSGTGTSDSMLALVSNTEAVITAAQTAKNVSVLGQINRGERDFGTYPDTGRPPGPPIQVATAAPQTTNTVVVNPPAGIDVHALAAAVSRELELMGKVS